VMMDLERVVPAGVQVTSIEPSVSVEHDVNIHLRVSGDRDRVVDLVRNLERSQRFLNPRPANETAQTQEHGGVTPVAQIGVPGGVQFDILSGYNPLPPVDKATLEKDKAAKEVPAATAPVHKAVVKPKPSGAVTPGTSGKAAVKRGVQ
jgi:type IV pilus assembly protein PilN